MPSPELPVVAFPTASSLEAWLLTNHATAPGVWLKIAKKASGIPSVTYAEAVDIALCVGWIDGQKRAFDAQYFLQRFTPRRARSIWSKVNCARVEWLIAEARVTTAGLAAVEAAKADGRWDAAYDPASANAVPVELQDELALRPDAARFFETISRANRYAFCFRVQSPSRPETRRNRAAKFAEMLGRGEVIYPGR